jgi:hypothetical protein
VIERRFVSGQVTLWRRDPQVTLGDIAISLRQALVVIA